MASYLVLRYLCFPSLNALLQVAVSVAVCAVWSIVLFGREGLDFAISKLKERRQSEVTEPVEQKAVALKPAEELVGAS